MVGFFETSRIVRVAMNNTCPVRDEPRPRCPTSGNAVGRLRGKVDPGSGLGLQEVN
ncbi:hypothetical protein NKH49_18495 [Mesorhizobium sp. M1088]